MYNVFGITFVYHKKSKGRIMEYLLKKWSRNLEVLKIQVYNQKLQLIYSGQLNKGEEPQARSILDGCSLLFDIKDTSYFLKKY